MDSGSDSDTTDPTGSVPLLLHGVLKLTAHSRCVNLQFLVLAEDLGSIVVTMASLCQIYESL